jgi:hypothetical protein
LDSINEKTLDERKFPGVTHVLSRDGDHHAVAVIMLKTVTDMIRAGQLALPTEPSDVISFETPKKSGK